MKYKKNKFEESESTVYYLFDSMTKIFEALIILVLFTWIIMIGNNKRQN
jgi:hypothetical protein